MLAEITIPEKEKRIVPGNFQLGGTNPSGDSISFTNYYMTVNGKPFFGICGEYHYSRCDSGRWEDEIVKMKMDGVNVLSTYIIWIHHEEEEGIFDWTGNRDLRKFVELCSKHKMNVILRVGPFSHGEVRNGGMPDWLYGRPFEVRSNDERYLFYVRRLYKEIESRVAGLMYKDGGPVIGIQLENEYMAAAAPWEITPPQITEWMTPGNGGKEHIEILKKIAIECGLEAPVYTCTGWGGAPVPEEGVLPLYGDYAFCPWLFYNPIKEHPPTDAYLFRDYHNEQSFSGDFKPSYPKTKYPYACCEMGGGMQVWYDYRFTVPPESVEAMTLMKIGGGCNFVGYYMFHGGTNPVGKHGYLNEHTCPKISYDFQAPLGEFGQVRESYKRLKRVFVFAQDYQDSLCRMQTFLPEGSENLKSTDTGTLRYAVRVSGDHGFVFLNNYQDHVQMKDHPDCALTLKLKNESLRLPHAGSFLLKKNVSCILPFNFDMDGALLKYATAQLITHIEADGVKTYFFFVPEGMSGEYCFKSSSVMNLEAFQVNQTDDFTIVKGDPFPDEETCFEIETVHGKKIRIVTMTHERSLNFWKVHISGQERALFTDANLIETTNGLKLESMGRHKIFLGIFPECAAFETAVKESDLKVRSCKKKCGRLYDELELEYPSKKIEFEQQTSGAKAVVKFGEGAFEGLKDIILKIEYSGDVGYAFLNGKLISDNFCNGAPWEVGLKELKNELVHSELDLSISPLKKNSRVQSDSTMAARFEIAGEQIAEFTSFQAVPVYEAEINLK